MVRGAFAFTWNESARLAAPLLHAVFLSLESRRRHAPSCARASPGYLFAQFGLERDGRRWRPPLRYRSESGAAVSPFRICAQAARPFRARSICAHVFLSAAGLA